MTDGVRRLARGCGPCVTQGGAKAWRRGGRKHRAVGAPGRIEAGRVHAWSKKEGPHAEPFQTKAAFG
jgi:hypothetical protein